MPRLQATGELHRFCGDRFLSARVNDAEATRSMDGLLGNVEELLVGEQGPASRCADEASAPEDQSCFAVVELEGGKKTLVISTGATGLGLGSCELIQLIVDLVQGQKTLALEGSLQ